ncbi:MAG: sugar isomerase [Phycisphaerae bacterium]|nr:sugar isomerase [Phycisphaerae bacterium]
MNTTDEKYTKYALTREMLETADVVRNFNPQQTESIAKTIAAVGRLMLTGEGSSRIFPAKNMIRKAMVGGLDLQIATDGSRQTATYDLSKFATFAASNSGRTKEVVKLLQKLKAEGISALYGLTAKEDNLLEEYATETLVLTCGWENAVAATKSVAEQALIYQSIIGHISSLPLTTDALAKAADAIDAAMTMEIDPAFVKAACDANTIYFAGYNDGVAEELTLKTNEITRKKSDFLEGTYAAHGIEEVMDASDVVFVIEPFIEELPKFQEVLVEGVGLKVVCIATEQTQMPTIVVPDAGELNPYVFLAAGWNLLVEIGLTLSIDLDKPERARKVGNEFEG